MQLTTQVPASCLCCAHTTFVDINFPAFFPLVCCSGGMYRGSYDSTGKLVTAIFPEDEEGTAAAAVDVENV